MKTEELNMNDELNQQITPTRTSKEENEKLYICTFNIQGMTCASCVICFLFASNNSNISKKLFLNFLIFYLI